MEEFVVPDAEMTAYQQIRHDHFEEAQEAADNDGMLLVAIMTLLLDRGIINIEDLEKKFFQTIVEHDQESAKQRDDWVADMRAKCPTICQHLDEHFGPGWGPNDLDEDD